jgi:hypothetical protein
MGQPATPPGTHMAGVESGGSPGHERWGEGIAPRAGQVRVSADICRSSRTGRRVQIFDTKDYRLDGWHAFIESAVPTPNGTVVSLRVSPILASTHGASVTVVDRCHRALRGHRRGCDLRRFVSTARRCRSRGHLRLTDSRPGERRVADAHRPSRPRRRRSPPACERRPPVDSLESGRDSTSVRSKLARFSASLHDTDPSYTSH